MTLRIVFITSGSHLLDMSFCQESRINPAVKLSASLSPLPFVLHTELQGYELTFPWYPPDQGDNFSLYQPTARRELKQVPLKNMQ